MSPLPARSLLCAALLAPAAFGQSVTRVVPEVADPGDTVRIEGQGLGGVTGVRFTAQVGGFVGTWAITVAPTSVAPGAVVAVVPQFDNFTPPRATPPGTFVGSVAPLVGAQPVGQLAFGYLESTFGEVALEGQGGSELPGPAPRFSLDLGIGLPVAGQAFTPELVDALPGAQAFLVLGAPATPPFLPVFGGEATVDPFGPLVVQFAGGVALDGTLALPLVVPPAAQGFDVAWQWVAVDPATFTASTSNGLWAAL